MNKEQVLGLIRHALTFIGGVVVANGMVTEGISADIIGAVMTLIGAFWSIASNK